MNPRFVGQLRMRLGVRSVSGGGGLGRVLPTADAFRLLVFCSAVSWHCQRGPVTSEAGTFVAGPTQP